MITLDDSIQIIDSVGFVMSRNAETAWNVIKFQLADLTEERDRLQTELFALRKRIDDAPECELRCIVEGLVRSEIHEIDMQPGETRRFKLVRAE